MSEATYATYSFREKFIAVRTFFLVSLIIGGVAYASSFAHGTNGLSPSMRIIAVWPTDAVLLSIILRGGMQPHSNLLGAGFFGNILANIAAGDNLPTSIVLASCDIFEVAIALTLLARCGNRLTWQKVFFDTTVRAGIAAPALSATLAASTLAVMEHAHFVSTWSVWFMSHTLGMFIIVLPFKVTMKLNAMPDITNSGKLLETLLIPIVLIVIELFVFEQKTHPLLFTIFPILMLAAFRLHFLGAALLMFVTACVAISYTQIGLGPLSLIVNATRSERIFLLQFFLIIAALTTLPISAILYQRTELQRDLRKRLEELAKAYEREKHVAKTFQEAALSPHLPRVPGLILDAVYQPGHAEALVGGDWYDAFRLPDGRIVLSIGDVAGSGLQAAVTMGSVRQSIRTAALINPDPVAILDAVDRIVCAMNSDQFVTAFVGVLDPLFFEFSYANAGHPPPLIRKPDGTVLPISQGDLPLGLRQRGSTSTRLMNIKPGSLLAFYTDGLTELERNPLEGEKKIIEALMKVSTPYRAAQELYHNVLGEQIQHDDVAILVVTFEHTLGAMRERGLVTQWEFNVNDVETAHEKRRIFLHILQEAGFTPGELASAELVFGELLGNVVRYASGEVTIVLDMSDEMPVLHVLDNGYGFEHNPRLPRDLMSERGRGLFLVGAFAEEAHISKRKGGGSHARVVLAGRIRCAATLRAAQ